MRGVRPAVRVHDGFVKLPDATTVQIFDDTFRWCTEDSQKAPTGADLRGVGTVSLSG